jgi:hypothetical protein
MLTPPCCVRRYCLVAAVHRAIMHWLTPVPGLGTGGCHAAPAPAVVAYCREEAGLAARTGPKRSRFRDIALVKATLRSVKAKVPGVRRALPGPFPCSHGRCSSS